MKDVFKELEELKSEKSLSRQGIYCDAGSYMSYRMCALFCSKTQDLITRVLQQRSQDWDKTVGSVVAGSSQPSVGGGPTASKLNTDAPVFVPAGEMEFDFQQPVRNAGESHSPYYRAAALSSVYLFCRGMERVFYRR